MDKTKIYISSIAAISLFVVIGFVLFARDDYSPREDLLEDQLEEKNKEIAQLKAKTKEHVNEVKELNAEVARLISSEPGAGRLEERRQALAEKEAELQHKKSRLVSREEALRLAEIKVDNLQKEFYEKTGLKFEEIGEAKQIKKEYEYMREGRQKAEARANAWLIYFSILLTAFVGSIISVIVIKMKMDAKNRNIEAAIHVVDSISLTREEKNVLLSSLDKHLLIQSASRGEKT